MYSAIFLVLLALANVVAPIGFLVGISYQAPLVSCNGQDISFDWVYISSTGIPPDTSRWFYKSRAGDIELMYTLQSNTEGRPTQLYTRRVMVERRTQMHGTGITLRNVSQNDNGLYFVELSFRLEFTLKLVSNEDNGTFLTVIDCPKETPKIHKFENRTIQCSSSKSFKDLKLAIFKDGEQQTNAFLESDDLILNVDNSSHGDYYCGYIYPSKPFVNIIGTPRSSTIHITEVGPTGDNQIGEDQNDDKKKGAPQYIKLVLGIAVVFTVLIVLGIVFYIAIKRNTRSRHRENEKQQHDLNKMPTDLPSGSGEPSPPTTCESVDITYMPVSNDDQITQKVTEVDKAVAQVHKGNAYDKGAYTYKELQNIETASELEEDTKIAEEVEEPSIFSAATQHLKKKYPKWAK